MRICGQVCTKPHGHSGDHWWPGMTTPRPSFGDEVPEAKRQRSDTLTAESEAYMAEVYPDFLEPTKTLGVLRARLRKCLAAIERAAEDRAREAWGEARIAAFEDAIAAARADADRELAALRGLTDRLALYLSESVEHPFWPAGTREAFVEFLALPKHNGADYVFARRNIRAALATLEDR